MMQQARWASESGTNPADNARLEQAPAVAARPLPRFDKLIWLASFGAPLTLAIVDLLHPHVHDLFAIDLTRWMAVHHAQIILFPLAACSQAVLIRGERGYAAALSRVAMFVFALTYIALIRLPGS